MPDRQPYRPRVEVRPRFRCLVCQRFVAGSDHGACPRCGWEPPSVTPRRPRAGVPRLALLLGVLALLVALLGWTSAAP
ncbi:MAG: hypothetical protein HS111_30245 [Kofleriaceae bacterium]|nr:hypothetical protein [Kofleriaceae bacterium]MCL4224607.1 hypothetical protein [Myxococcales bacterium]